MLHLNIAGIVVSNEIMMWGGFFGLVLVLLALDLGVFNRKAHKIGVREALKWSAFWIALAVLFGIFVFFTRGKDSSAMYFTAYALEKSLSVDNLFVFLIILSYFSVKDENWHRVLFWGIIGALLMRGLFIGVGIAVISRFEWVLYIFGAILVYTAVKIAFKGDDDVHPENNPVLKSFRKVLPMSKDYDGAKFFTRHKGKLLATPLFLVLIAIETTDIVFALDSVPAVLAVSQDAFIVYTSNVFAILGLRALFFAVAGAMENIFYLNYGLSVILAFIGAKIFFALDYIQHYLPWIPHFEIDPMISLAFVLSVLAVAIVASLVRNKRKPAHAARDGPAASGPPKHKDIEGVDKPWTPVHADAGKHFGGEGPADGKNVGENSKNGQGDGADAGSPAKK